MKAGHLVAFVAAGGALIGAGAYLARASSSADLAASSSSSASSAITTPVASAPGLAPAHRAAVPTPALQHAAPMPGLAADLRDADPRVRRAATAELARDPDGDPRALLVASRDPDLEVSVVATTALGKLYASGALPASELVARIRDRDLPEKVRASALNGLGAVATPETAALLAELAQRGDTLDRRSAAILLGRQDPAIAVPALIAALGDADDYVRANAAESLRHLARGRDFGTDANAWRSWWQSRGS